MSLNRRKMRVPSTYFSTQLNWMHRWTHIRTDGTPFGMCEIVVPAIVALLLRFTCEFLCKYTEIYTLNYLMQRKAKQKIQNGRTSENIEFLNAVTAAAALGSSNKKCDWPHSRFAALHFFFSFLQFNLIANWSFQMDLLCVCRTIVPFEME